MFYNQQQNETNKAFTPLTEKELNNYTQNINKLLKYCKKQNIKLYIFIAPAKEYIYREQNFMHPSAVDEKTKALVENVKNTLNYDIIYPVEQFKQLKEQEYVFFKIDHHLTDSASFIVYKILMERIKQDFKDVKITDETEFNISYNNLVRYDYHRKYEKGCNYTRSGIDDQNLLKIKYKYYDYKKLESIKRSCKTNDTHINKNGKYKVLVFGNSYCETLLYFLNTSFKEIKKYRCPPLHISDYLPSPPKKKQKPDILLLVLSTGFIDRLNNLYINEDK